MNNYDQLIQKLGQDPHLQILKQDYATIIDSMKDTDLSVRQMIAILWAAENDCLKFTSEIDKLNAMIQQLQQQLVQENAPQESILSAEDEHQEILYEIEQQLIFNVQKLSENQLINFTIQKYDKLDYQTALDIITKFIESKCLNKEVEGILNQQLQDQMIKYQKNYILQIENMKILSNTSAKDFYQKQKLQSFSFDRIKLKFQAILKEIKSLKRELQQTKEIYQMQFKLLFHQDNIIDKMLTSQQFNFIYNKILTQLNHQRKYFNMSGQVQQSLLASQQIDNNDISIVFDKLQQKLVNQIAKTACQVTANFEEIVTSRQINNNYLELILNTTKANFTKILKYNKMISTIQQEKETLQGQIRSSMECLIQKLNDENIKLKLIHLTKVIEKSFKNKANQVQRVQRVFNITETTQSLIRVRLQMLFLQLIVISYQFYKDISYIKEYKLTKYCIIVMIYYFLELQQIGGVLIITLHNKNERYKIRAQLQKQILIYMLLTIKYQNRVKQLNLDGRINVQSLQILLGQLFNIKNKVIGLIDSDGNYFDLVQFVQQLNQTRCNKFTLVSDDGQPVTDNKLYQTTLKYSSTSEYNNKLHFIDFIYDMEEFQNMLGDEQYTCIYLIDENDGLGFDFLIGLEPLINNLNPWINFYYCFNNRLHDQNREYDIQSNTLWVYKGSKELYQFN